MANLYAPSVAADALTNARVHGCCTMWWRWQPHFVGNQSKAFKCMRNVQCSLTETSRRVFIRNTTRPIGNTYDRSPPPPPGLRSKCSLIKMRFHLFHSIIIIIIACMATQIALIDKFRVRRDSCGGTRARALARRSQYIPCAYVNSINSNKADTYMLLVRRKALNANAHCRRWRRRHGMLRLSAHVKLPTRQSKCAFH